LNNGNILLELPYKTVDTLTDIFEQWTMLNAMECCKTQAEAVHMMEQVDIFRHELRAQGFDGKPRQRF